jgi:hypothetical protein
LGQKQERLFPESTDVVIAYGNNIGMNRLKRMLGPLKDTIPSVFVTNLDDAQESIVNCCIGKPLDYRSPRL